MACLKDLAKEVAVELGVSLAVAQRATEVVLYTIDSFCQEGESVTIKCFGKFYQKNYPERKCRNPQTGEEMTAPARSCLAFKAAKAK